MIIARALQSNLLRTMNASFFMLTTGFSFYKSIDKQVNSFSNQRDFEDSGLINKSRESQKSEDKSTKTNQVTESQNELDDNENRSVKTSSKMLDKQNKQFAFFFNLSEDDKLATIEEFKQKDMIKQLSIIARQMHFMKQRSQMVWCAMEDAFIYFLKPTEDQEKIRSIGKYLHALSKSKKASRNYQTYMALILPYSSKQSFTQIIASLSRMGGLSEQFCHIVQKLYWKRKSEFSALQLNLLNYALAKNGKKIDPSLIDNLDSFPLRGIALMLRTYDKSKLLTDEILKKCAPAILARKTQTDFFDLRQLINLYTKYKYLDNPELIKYFQESYKTLARNVNEQTIEEIWQYLPDAINLNKIPVSLVQEIIKSLKILKIRRRINDRTWKKISATFGQIQNLQIRTKLQKIY